ncbi:MAG: hypothetical protein H6983_15920 [Ectothiorhodospiraceae bacterium]|nr:hypothetical protein [Chromatiales bacterium]MCP5155659.1 hypothetical protein [Ectothiorhodospiraceae bacterium]
MKRLGLVTAAAVSILILTGWHATPASAQEPRILFIPSHLSVPASALVRQNDNSTYDTNGVRMVTGDGGVVSFHAPVELPDIALISGVTLEAFDESADVEFGGFVRVWLREFRFNTFLDIGGSPIVQTDAAGAPGNVRVNATLPGLHQVDNAEHSYGLLVQLFNGAAGPFSVGYYKVVIHYYRLEVY